MRHPTGEGAMKKLMKGLLLTAQALVKGTSQNVRSEPTNEALKATIEPIVNSYVERVGDKRGRSSSYYIHDLTCECLREIVTIEPLLAPAPSHGEYLYRWEQRNPPPVAKPLAAEIFRRMQERQQQLEQQLLQEQRASDSAKGQQLLDKYEDVVNKFFEIAERKVSQLDDYGDERLHLLPKEVDACVVKIAGREGLAEAEVRGNLKDGNVFLLPAPLQLMHSRMPQLFAEYHERQKSKVRTKDEVRSLSGTEFETYVAQVLKQNGWQVSGTPTTGDQGADLIASKADRKVVIQAKRYVGSVGNRAVQEVVGAVSFYGGTEGCVVTNSTFTPSARALAQKNNIRLIDGASLDELRAL